jgi:formylmethanofuran:tetrahydromethanopterin formyltransferase
VRRLFWFGAGVAAGVAVSRKFAAAARKATPVGAAEQVGGAVRELAGAVGSFGADVRSAMSERESELQEVVDSAVQPRRRPRRTEIDSVAWPSEHAADARDRRARRAGR